MILSNFLWYGPAGDRYWYFLLQWGFAIAIILAVVALGRFRVGLRPWICGAAYITMPVSGLVMPMAKHLGDATWEITGYIQQQHNQWKGGELLGTLPFYVLGKYSLVFRHIDDWHLARLLALVGLVGGAGFLVLAVELASPASAPRKASWRSFFVDLSRTDLGYAYLLSFASLPSFLMYAGFIQTTYLPNLLLPWALFLLARASRPCGRGAFAIAAQLAWVLAAWLAMGALYLGHGTGIVIVLGALSAAIARFGRMLWRALRKRGAEWQEWLASGFQVLVAIATLPLVARFVLRMTKIYPKVFRDPWVPARGTTKERLLALRAITHVIPSWVPVFGQRRPSCGQQTWLFSREWALFTVTSLAHVTPLLVVLAWGVWSFVRRWKSRERVRLRFALGEPLDWAFFVSALLGLGFISLYSPHFSQPGDMDVLFIPASAIGIFAITAIARWSRTGEPPRGRVWCLSAIAIYQLVLLFAARLAQSELAVPYTRGISGPWC